MTTDEMIAKGYSAFQSGDKITVYQNGERVATLSPLFNHPGFGFDWHRADQWGLRSHDVVALVSVQP